MIRSLVSIVALTACAALPLQAQDADMVGDRPDFTESAQTVPVGRIQLEAGATYSDFEGNNEAVTYGEALLRIGLAETFELRGGLGSWVDIDIQGRDVNGFDGASIGVKWAPGPVAGVTDNFAVIVGTSLPWGDRDFAERAWQPGITLAGEWGLSESTGLGMNVGYTYARSDGERFDQLKLSASVGFEVNERVGAFVEAYAFSEESPDGSFAPYLDTGLVYSVHDNLALDARVGAGLGQAETDFFAGVGVVGRF